MDSSHFLARWKGRRNAFDMLDGGEHDVYRMHDLLQNFVICSVQTAVGCV